MSRLKIFLFIFILAFIACNKEQSNEPISELPGMYESNRFIEPGSADGGVNILSSGGHLRITFDDDFIFHSELFIPQAAASNYPQGYTHYDGSFSIMDQTIKFDSANFFLDSIRWEPESKKLETFEVSPRGQPFKIILYKSSR